MADPEDLSDAIADASQDPLKTEFDGVSIEERPIAEKILGDQYRKANAVASGWGAALRPARVVPPDTLGPRNTTSSGDA